jgi:outer membrane protein insertion porin family
MRNLWIIFLFLAGSASSQIIVNIEVKGTVRSDPGFVIAASGMQIGADLSSELTRNAIKRLFRLGLFKDVRIDTEPQGGGVKVVIVVEENPRLLSCKFIGNRVFKDKKLSEICGLKEGDMASDNRIFDGKAKLLEEYKKKGFYLVTVEPKWEKTENGDISLKYFIDEGKKVRIKKIEIVGNKTFSDGKIESQMKNREKRWWRKGNFNEEEFGKDKDRILEFYRNNGFPNCELTSIDVNRENSGWITIVVTVNEGKRFYFGAIKFDGNEVVSLKTLTDNTKFKNGTVYGKKKLQETIAKFYEIYGNEGYLYLKVNPEERVRDSSLVDITFHIEEGEPAILRKIIIKGNGKTHEKVIRRELTLFPGDIMRRREVIRSQKRVFNLGFFKNITLDTKVVNDSGDIDLTLGIEEKQTGQVSAGMGYGGEVGLTGNLSLSIPNLLGRGEMVYMKYERGSKLTNIELGGIEPWLFDTPTSVNLGIFHLTEQRIGFYDKRTGGNIGIGRPIPRFPYTRGHIGYRLERIEIERSDTTRYLKSAISPSIVRDSRDNFLNPTEGTRNSLDMEFSGLGGDVKFQKFVLESHFYHPIFWRWVFLMRARTGVILSSSGVPAYEKFVLGGVGDWSLRGYPDYSIGPVRNGIIGGRFAGIITFETKLKFEENIYPILFIESGNAWDSITDCNIGGLKTGIGVGVRMEIPMMGLLGFDFAYGVDEKQWTPHFQVGKEF